MMWKPDALLGSFETGFVAAEIHNERTSLSGVLTIELL